MCYTGTVLRAYRFYTGTVLLVGGSVLSCTVLTFWPKCSCKKKHLGVYKQLKYLWHRLFNYTASWIIAWKMLSKTKITDFCTFFHKFNNFQGQFRNRLSSTKSRRINISVRECFLYKKCGFFRRPVSTFSVVKFSIPISWLSL